MRPIVRCCLALACLVAGCAAPAPERYLFYLHGQIVEGSTGRPQHPQYGVYDYPAIVAALEQRGFSVISEIRESDTDGQAYARRVADQVRELLSAGVPAERVTVVGTSKGGAIAVAVSAILNNRGLNFVIMGTCVDWIRDWPELELRGRILSIVEQSDTVAGSCRVPFQRSRIEPRFHEITIRTGRGHGAFYDPAPEWLEPLARWASGREP